MIEIIFFTNGSKDEPVAFDMPLIIDKFAFFEGSSTDAEFEFNSTTKANSNIGTINERIMVFDMRTAVINAVDEIFFFSEGR